MGIVKARTDSGVELHVGDRVRGRNGFAFTGLRGTVVEVVHEAYVRIEWDHFSIYERRVLGVRPWAVEVE